MMFVDIISMDVLMPKIPIESYFYFSLNKIFQAKNKFFKFTEKILSVKYRKQIIVSL